MSEPKVTSRKLTLMAMLAAMAYVAMLITRPLPTVAGFLSYDLKDVIIAIAGFLLGPADFTPGSFGNVHLKDFKPQSQRGHRYHDEADRRPIWVE